MGCSTPSTERIGDYIVGEELGRGGMGMVFRARHNEGGAEVALKLIASHLSSKTHATRRFEAEGRALRRINHSNVVRLLDFGRLPDGTMFHVTELLEGQPLAVLLQRQKRFSARAALPFVLQICAGLQAAHDRSVVHRDLKPDNIFVVCERPLQIKLFDFGVARLLDADEGLTATGMLVGTPLFVAPEQAMGLRRQISPRTDIYSVGVLIYAMLCGEPPFTAEGFGALLASHVQDPAPPLQDRAEDIPREVAQVVHWCLEKEPDRRPISARILAAAYAGAVRVSTDRRLTPAAAIPPTRPPSVDPADQADAVDDEENLETCIYAPEDEEDRSTVVYHPLMVGFAPTLEQAMAVEDPPPTPLLPTPRRRRSWPILLGATAVLLAVAALTALVIALVG